MKPERLLFGGVFLWVCAGVVQDEHDRPSRDVLVRA